MRGRNRFFASLILVFCCSLPSQTAQAEQETEISALKALPVLLAQVLDFLGLSTVDQTTEGEKAVEPGTETTLEGGYIIEPNG